MENPFRRKKICNNDDNIDILKPLPEGNDPNQKYLNSQTSSGYPLIEIRKNDTYYSTKSELSTTEMINVSNNIISHITHFRFNKKVYILKDLKFQTLYQSEYQELISDNSLISSYQHHFNNLHDKPNLQTPIKVNYFKSKSHDGHQGTTKKDFKNLEYYHFRVYQIILYYFILKLNIETRKSNHDLPYHLRLNYYSFRSEVIKIMYHPIINLYKYIMTVGVYRTNKDNGFMFYLEVYFRPQNLDVIIEKCLVIGVFSQDKIIFSNMDGINNSRDSKKNIDISKITDENDDILGTSYQTILKLSQTTDEELIKKGIHPTSNNILSRDIDLTNKYQCFKPDNQIYHPAKTYNDCLSYTNELGKTGVWDKPCEKDDECPFFQNNKNYPNNRGKCQNGYCELPLGMKPIGYKHFTKDKPLCYNCHKNEEIITADGNSLIRERICSGVECNKCCDLQTNKKLYPNIISPDYAFKGDYVDRINQQSSLEKLNLGLKKLI